ncbi:MAG: D-glycero-beta-D-manno-heptose 1,7-bisphosphate 7-phosphatase [Thiocapsa sp.]|jgi:D-glycero-D-manno-heptose 1,7-bisphosphate phosphatase|nr:D-glycero-beta-D-manno-heptose 1,7-bisphosphate 7-phosphatase [Thiocapsa sp.]MCG6898311.1 D-glycero-beta-D-manno-heptose 1,7-bisphosphate 7-phosphatase [Thiocapsa sp.]MCG6985062.1 D-glycero-beta-D-manno-heptose 1,7-bisphosphate 7-phosphatase [Thiocapsa sp.]
MVDRVVILDRDGVINADSDEYIKTIDEWIPLPGSVDAIARLSHGGYRVAVATNQSGLARGFLTPRDLDAMHRMLRNLLVEQGGRVEMIVYCPHAPDEGCRCRKPRPGMLEEIGRRLSVDLAGVPFIGDSLGDIAAARAAGALPWLVRTGKGERALASGSRELAGVPVYRDLASAADELLRG